MAVAQASTSSLRQLINFWGELVIFLQLYTLCLAEGAVPPDGLHECLGLHTVGSSWLCSFQEHWNTPVPHHFDVLLGTRLPPPVGHKELKLRPQVFQLNNQVEAIVADLQPRWGEDG